MSRCGDCPLYDSNVKIDTKCKGDLDYEVCISALQNALYDALAIEIVRCKDCKHRPIKEDPDGENYGFNIIKPNGIERCPCLIEDGWYSWMPKDNFYCGFGEREDE